MIEIAEGAAELFHQAARIPGGFLWWYADLTNNHGDGCVLVWSLGLPFLPGSRDGDPAVNRPSVHFATYEKGRPHSYLLNQHEPDDFNLDLTTGEGTIGRSQFFVEEKRGSVSLIAELDEAIPRSKDRMRARLEVVGNRTSGIVGPPPKRHGWVPRSTDAWGKLDLGESFSFEGGAYFDSNASVEPLHDQGIESWRWGRVKFPKRTFVYYDVTGAEGVGDSIALEQDIRETRILAGDFQFSRYRRGKFGMKSPRALLASTHSGAIHIECRALVDDGPFYQRFLLEAEDESGEKGEGVGEALVPKLIDVPWQRPFVEMKIHRVSGRSSIWSPLFTGPAQRRVSRLSRSLFGWEKSR